MHPTLPRDGLSSDRSMEAPDDQPSEGKDNTATVLAPGGL